MIRPLFALSVLALAFPAEAFAGSYLRVESWNMRHEGWSGETDYLGDAEQIWFEFGSSSTSAAGCDVVFLQEVMNATVAPAIAAQLSTLSGKTWVAVTTPLIGRTTYKESYAFIYRSDRVTVDGWAVWQDTGDKFEREPMIVRLRDRATAADFTFINWHTVFGTTTQRAAELSEIKNVFTAVQNGDSRDQDVILLGDHNADATSNWWTNFKTLAPAVTSPVNLPTSFNSTGAYVSAYDHFWFQSSYLTEYSSSGRDYVQDPVTYVADISDHAPVWLKLYSSSDTD